MISACTLLLAGRAGSSAAPAGAWLEDAARSAARRAARSCCKAVTTACSSNTYPRKATEIVHLWHDTKELQSARFRVFTKELTGPVLRWRTLSSAGASTIC